VNILVSKINHLGDAVSFLPTLKGISDYVPDSKLTVVCTEAGRQVFEGTVPRAQFFVVNYKEVRSYLFFNTLLKGLVQLRGKRFTHSFHSYDEPSFAYLLSMVLKIRTRVGYSANIAKLQKSLTSKLPWDPSRNVVDVNFDFARWYAGNWELKPTRISIYYSPNDHNIVQQRLKGCGLLPKSNFIVIHPGAKLTYREWGINNYFQLASLIENELGLPVVFIGEKKHSSINHAAREIADLSIKQLACLFEMATLFIGNNSGPWHISTAMGTPSVVIQGPTANNWDIFWPEVKCRKVKAASPSCIPCEKFAELIPGSCLNQDYPNGCMKEVSIHQVMDAVCSLVRA